jgi:hypothetical protein
MASAAANDVSNAFNYNKITPDEQFEHKAKTAVTIARNKDEAAYYGSNNDNSGVAQSNRYYQDLARRSAMSVGAVGAAPSVPDPNAIGATEQALLDAQKKGRSATIETSATGLLSDEDSTRKKRSLMGGLIS